MVAGLRGVLMLCGWGPFVQLLQPHLSIGCHNCQQQSITRECVDDWELNLDDCSEDNCDEDQYWDDTNLERRRPVTEEWQRQRLILLVTPSSSSSSLFSNTLVTTDQQHWWILLLQCLLLESGELSVLSWWGWWILTTDWRGLHCVCWGGWVGREEVIHSCLHHRRHQPSDIEGENCNHSYSNDKICKDLYIDHYPHS